jgi:membrane protease YdiL (CAAX protease family)
MPGARKYIEVLIFVVVWMAAGWIFHLDANAYLLLGVPLVVLFQLFIRRRPLRNLWARDATSFRLGMIGVVLAVLLILAPGYDLLLVALPKKLWVVALWLVCAMTGAVFAAFAFGWQRASAARRGLPSFVVAVLIGIGIMAASALAGHHLIGFPLPKLVFLLKQFLLYFTVSFALEEVAFRGALDSHVYQPRSDGQASGSPWLSAIFVSALWGIWHLPTVPIPSAPAFVAAIPALIIIHALVGVPLSFCWRASGTLVLPAAAHALIDAYRNTVL